MSVKPDRAIQHKPKVDLALNSAGIVILFRSGVIYENQAGGHSCMRPSEEGVLVLLTDAQLVIDAPLEVYQCPVEAKLRTLEWRSFAPTEALASEIDTILQSYPPTQGISVDRTRLSDSMEAWVYVNVEPCEFAFYAGFGSCKGVLVWPNSD